MYTSNTGSLLCVNKAVKIIKIEGAAEEIQRCWSKGKNFQLQEE